MFNGDFGIDHQPWKSLTPAQRRAQMWLLVSRAHVARNRAVGRALLAVGKALLSAIGRLCGQLLQAVRPFWMRYLRHRQRMRELAQLAAMDDRSLRDIGISRMEIRAAMREGTDLAARTRQGIHSKENDKGKQHAESLLGRPRLGA